MTTLMRNGRDRRSENPGWVTRGKSAWFCLGPISGSHQGQRPNGRIYMTAPERFADSQIPLAPRAPSIHDRPCVKTHTSAKCRKHNSPVRHRTSRVQHDLTLRDAIARRYFYVWRDRWSFRTAKTHLGSRAVKFAVMHNIVGSHLLGGVRFGNLVTLSELGSVRALGDMGEKWPYRAVVAFSTLRAAFDAPLKRPMQFG